MDGARLSSFLLRIQIKKIKKKIFFRVGEGDGCCVGRVSDFFFQKNPTLKQFFEGMKVRDDWLV